MTGCIKCHAKNSWKFITVSYTKFHEQTVMVKVWQCTNCGKYSCRVDDYDTANANMQNVSQTEKEQIQKKMLSRLKKVAVTT